MEQEIKNLENKNPQIKIFEKINNAVKALKEENIKEFNSAQCEIINFDNADYAYLFARDIQAEVPTTKALNIEALQEIVVRNGSTLLNYEFVKNIKGSNRKIFVDSLKGKNDTYSAILHKKLENGEIQFEPETEIHD